MVDFTSFKRPARRDMCALFLGFVVTFAVMIGLGHYASTYNHFETFRRLNLFINPVTLYYPTSTEIVSMAKAAADNGRVPVIVGGSSIMYGATQEPAELWTKILQEALGDQYVVLNLALPAGTITEHGGVVTQALIRDGYHPIYIADTAPGFFPTADGRRWNYIFWDAYYKGLIMTDQYPSGLLEQLSHQQDTTDSGEMILKSKFDGWLYFTDFWNAIGYSTAFTVWNNQVAPYGPFYMARKTLPDINTQSGQARHDDPPLDAAMNIVRGQIRLICPRYNEGDFTENGDGSFFTSIESRARQILPDAVRSETMLVMPYYSPYYVSRVSAPEQGCYGRVYERVRESLIAAGYEAHIVGPGLTDDDYDDILHLSVSGGKKMVAQIVPFIKERARRAGYVQ